MAMALEGIKVIDLSRLAPGPYCGMILGDLGAEVIRVEAMDRRARAEGVLGLSDELAEMLRAFNPQGRNKRSIVLDLRKEEGREVFMRLAREADVIIEEFRPGVVKRLGIDYPAVREVNPGVIYCSITGYGQTGPYAGLPGHDLNYLAMAGALGVIRDEHGKPVFPSNLLADMAAGGMHAALCVLAALVARSLHGVGQYVDCAMTDGVVSLMHMEPILRHTTGLRGLPYYGVYETADGRWFSVGNVEPWLWENFCRALGREDLIPLQRDPGRHEELRAELREIFLGRTRDEWFAFFRDKDVCAAPVHEVEEAERDPHLREREMFVEFDHEKYGKITQVGISMKLSETPGRVRFLGCPPGLHTDEILAELGYGEEEIGQLREKGTVA
ncbi:MAG: CoA transferase [Actinobacteria bacterium]|nr:CoA transferase [Actinomycetota bacterium]